MIEQRALTAVIRSPSFSLFFAPSRFSFSFSRASLYYFPPSPIHIMHVSLILSITNPSPHDENFTHTNYGDFEQVRRGCNDAAGSRDYPIDKLHLQQLNCWVLTCGSYNQRNGVICPLPCLWVVLLRIFCVIVVNPFLLLIYATKSLLRRFYTGVTRIYANLVFPSRHFGRVTSHCNKY